jgi:hypothetical protein
MAVATGNLGRDRLGRRHIAIENRNPSACGGEGATGRSADPVPAAGDESDLSAEIFRHLLNSVAELHGVRLAQALLRGEDLTTAGAGDDP